MIVAISLACLTLLLMGTIAFRRKRVQGKKQQALAIVQRLYKLIGLVQKHRGMNASFLLGNTDATATIRELNRNIEALKNELHQYKLIQALAHWCAFVDHWGRLGKRSDGLTLESNFYQHTKLVENLLFVLEDMADSVRLRADNLAQTTQANMVWRELPGLVEVIGQARAVGMSVTTSGKCSQIDKVKLSYLHQKILTCSDSVFAQLNQQGSAVHDDQAMICQAQVTCQQLTDTLYAKLIEVNRVVMSSDAYFQLATNCMESMNHLLNKKLMQITEQAIDKR